ncbi:hypothetical protein [Methylobacterium haplocladii]|nr:hypothetical protein [Methylobacterium haplocladii]
MNYSKKSIMYFSILSFGCLFCSQEALSKSCSDITSGARPISEYSDQDDNIRQSFLDQYPGACLVRWVGGTRGYEGRESDRRKCDNLPNSEKLVFVPDSGSNYNDCVFRIKSDDNAGSNSDNADNISTEDDYTTKYKPPAASPQYSPRIKSGVVTFRMKNKAKYIIEIAFYSDNRKNWAWPSFSSHWTLKDREFHDYRLGCEIGESVCYGAWYKNQTKYWGVGMENKHSCSSCCLVCGTEEEDKKHTWTLGN